jgi:hypothetical protein
MAGGREVMGEFRYRRGVSIANLVISGAMAAGVLFLFAMAVLAHLGLIPVKEEQPTLVILATAGVGATLFVGLFCYGFLLQRNLMLDVSESGIRHKDLRGREASARWEQIAELRVRSRKGGHDWWLGYRAHADAALRWLALPGADALDTNYTALRDTVVARAGLTGPERYGIARQVWRRSE